MNYTRLTVKQQLTSVREQVLVYEQEHYNLTVQELINGEPTEMGKVDGVVFTSADRRKILESGVELLGKEEARLVALLPAPTPVETSTGPIELPAETV